MSTATDLLADADIEADFRNAEVLQAAFRARGLRCGDCNYPQNAAIFDSLLFAYADAKVDEHYHFVRYDPPYWREDMWSNDAGHGRCVEAARVKARTLRWRLTAMWPCERCMKRFNPTKRYRRMWKFLPKCLPTNVAKEFLDD